MPLVPWLQIPLSWIADKLITEGKIADVVTNRLPTTGEKAALAGLGTPSAGNKYVCEDQMPDKTKIAVLTPSGAIVPAAAGAEQAQTDGVNFSYYTLNFDKDAEESAFWEFALPPDFDATKNIVADIWWFAPILAVGAAKWGVSVGGRADGEVWDAALGGEQTVTDTTEDVAGELNKCAPTAFSSGWAAGDLVIVKLARKAADGADTLNEDAKVVMVVISYEVTK